MSTTRFTAIIPASGIGDRMGSDIPKQYMRINGKTILRHTVDVFVSHPLCDRVIVAIHADHESLFQTAFSGLTAIKHVIGGNTRKESVFNALSSIPNTQDDAIILIHDAARPCVTHNNINAALQALTTHKAVSLSMPITDTIIDGQGHKIDRAGKRSVQTPQGFRYQTIMQAHQKTYNAPDHVTDDAGLMSAMGESVAYIDGSRHNIKITMPDDLNIAEKFLTKNSYETRVGTGFDVHKFTSNRPLILCGVTIPHEQGLAGHSDADVGLHALTDAVLGAIGAGDIGVHFPPTDNSFKNMNSFNFLERALYLLHERNGALINCDITLICEQPKITPHVKTMIDTIAKETGLDASRINIKATTTERLGFTGREEGIAAQAVATVKVPA